MTIPRQKRRILLLKAAERLFIHYGPAKTTVADIARSAGIGVGTVYLEFPSKDDILAELATRRHAEVLARMRQITEDPDLTTAERLQKVFDARFQAFLDTGQGGVHAPDLVHCGCPGVEAAWATFEQQERDLLTALLGEGSRTGEFNLRDPDHTASVLLKAYATFSPPLLFHHKTPPSQEDLTLLHSLILRGLVSR